MALVFGDTPFSGRTPGQGEKELDSFTEVGKQFYVPNKDAEARLNRYLKAEELADLTKHKELWRDWRMEAPGSDTERHWIPVDLPGVMGRLMRHYCLGEEFHVRAKLRGEPPSGEEAVAAAVVGAQRQAEALERQLELESIMHQVCEVLPHLGDAVLRLDLVDKENEETGEDGPMAVLRYVEPTQYFPGLSVVDQTQVETVTLAWLFEMPRELEFADPARKDRLLLREVHTPGQISYQFNRWDGSKVGDAVTREELREAGAAELAALEDRETGIDEIPIVHFGWQTRAGNHFGRSETLRAAPLVLSLENRMAQLDEVLEKHARPKLIVGPGVLDDQGRANLRDFDVIQVEPDVFEKAVKPEYLTWNMQVEAVKTQVQKLEEYLFMTTETSPASFGLDRDGSQVDSARALRFKAHRTVNKVQDARTELARGIRAIFRIAQKLELSERREGGRDGFRRFLVEPRFGDPILEDQSQEVQDYVMRKQAGLVSRRKALMDLDNLPREEAELEVQAILQDQVDEAAASTATLGGIPPEAAPPAGTAGPFGTGEVEEVEPEPEV